MTAQKLRIHIDDKLLEEEVTVDEFIDMQEGRIRTIRNVLAKFVIDEEGKRLEETAARRMVGKMSLKQLRETSQEFTRQAEGVAVPEE